MFTPVCTCADDRNQYNGEPLNDFEGSVMEFMRSIQIGFVLLMSTTKCLSLLMFIARQHAMHAERDVVISFLSVCLSVQCLPVNEWIYRHIFDDVVGHHSSFFRYPPPLKNFKVNPSAGAFNTMKMGKICNYRSFL